MKDPSVVEINDLLQVKLLDDPNAMSYGSRVEDVRPGCLDISWPTDRGVLIPIGQDCLLSLSFVRDDAAYAFSATVEAKEREPIPYLRVKPLGPPERMQRRLFFRVRVAVPVELVRTVSAGPSRPGGASFFRTSTYDLSGGGLSIRVESSLPTGTVLEARLDLPDGFSPIRIPVRVVTCVPLAMPNEKPLNRVGMSYLAISEAERTRIMRHLFKVQMEQLTSG